MPPLQDALLAAITFLSAFAVAVAVVPHLRSVATRYQWLDQPDDERRVHTVAVPRIGGIAIYLGFVIAVAVTVALPVERFAEEVERLLILVVGATAVVMVMLYDDAVGIAARPKLLLQIGISLIVIAPRLRSEQSGIVIEQFNLPYLGEITLPLIVAIAFTVFWIVGMMNALNWSDGLDGLAAMIALAASTVLFLHTFFWPRGNPQFTISLLAIALVGAVAGFILFNWHPASIIMGDTGAMFLGFALATISIIGGAKIATALLALSVPIIDMAWVIVWRTLNGRSPFDADRGHLHHRLLDSGWTQPQIVLSYGALTLGVGILGLLLPTRELKLFALIAVGGVVMGAIAWLARNSEQAGQDQSEPLSRPKITNP